MHNQFNYKSIIVMKKTVLILALIALSLQAQLKKEDNCRFAKQFKADDLISSPSKLDDFLRQFVRWQAKFIKEVGVHQPTGLTLDGIRVDVKTGELLPESLHQFTASSKESIHLGVMAAVLEGSQYADQIYQPKDVFALIEQKTKALEDFYQKYPGFAGFLPWVTVTSKGVNPAHDFLSRVPALDNGQMFWAALSLSYVWQEKYPNVLPQLRERFDKVYWKLMIQNARKVFFNQTTGKIRAVANIKDVKQSVNNNEYTNNDDYYLNDPYEGELFTWIITLLCKDTFSPAEIDFIWQDKRRMLKPAGLHVRGPCTFITVQKGYWFSSHEQWKNLFLPYNLSTTYKFLQYNNELARVWNSFQKNIPGLYGAMAGPAQTNTQDTGYFAAGIEEVAFQKVQFDKLVTPYGAFPLFLVNKEYGAAWLHNTIYSPCGQTKYGALQGTGLDGSLMSPTLTWDTKITTVLSIFNGTRGIMQRFLEKQKLTDQFVSILERQYNLAFPFIDGGFLDLVAPGLVIQEGRPDFTSCQ